MPVLWDRRAGRIVSNDYAAIEIDLATQLSRWSNGADTYPAAWREDIAALDDWIGPAVNRGITATDPESRARLVTTLAELDDRLAGRRYLLGDRLTVADIRLWVSLVRYGADLTEYPHLWTYARSLFREPAFRDTTRFASFTPVGVPLPDWEAPIVD